MCVIHYDHFTAAWDLESRKQQCVTICDSRCAGAPGRLQKAREIQAASTAYAFQGHMPSSLSRGVVSFKVDKKENQFRQANSKHLQQHVDSSSGKSESSKGITFAKATRQQELRCGQFSARST